MRDGVIAIYPDGTAQSLYQDAHPCLELGNTVDIERASDVRFDNAAQEWKIYVKNAEGVESIIGKGHKTREEAINEEIEILEAQLLSGEINID